MPKIVDHDQRRAEIVQAAWGLVSKRGIESASLRHVAEAMGVSKASLNHYVDSQAHILAMCVEDMNDSIVADAEKLGLDSLDEDKIVQILLLIVPTTPRRRRQAALWLHLVGLYGSKLVRPSGRKPSEVTDVLSEVNRYTHEGVVFLLTLMREQGLVESDFDLDYEADVLHGLLDGLSLQSLTDGGSMTRERLEADLRRYVRSLMVKVPA